MSNNGHTNRCEGNPRSIKVLMYHRIVDDPAISRKHWTALHVNDFRRQLELMDQWGFTPMLLRDYQLYLEGRLDLPRKPVILTFDDGYLDFYRIAYPVLQEYGARAVIFVLGEKKIKSNYWDHSLGIPEAPLMEGHQVVELAEAGFEIGSHSLSHPKLTQLAEDQVWEQVSRSRILLEILLDAPVSSFSYPYGMLNGAVKKAVKAAGYRFACSVGSGPAIFTDDPMEIRRITIQSSVGIPGFALRLLTPYQYYEWTRRKAGEAINHIINRTAGSSRTVEEIEQHIES